MFTLFVLQTILSGLAATSGLLFNGYILSVLVWQKRIQNANNLFLLNLAVVDIFFCLTILFGNTSLSILIGSSFTKSEFDSDEKAIVNATENPINSNIIRNNDDNLPWLILPQADDDSLLNLVSQVQGYLWTAFPIIFVWTVTGLTIDKYIAISTPLHYSRLITTRKAALFISLAWFVGLVLSFPPVLGTCTYAYSPYRSSNSIHCDTRLYPWTGLVYIVIYILFSILIPLLAITICNFHILLIAENHRHRIISAIYEITLRGGGHHASAAAAAAAAAAATAASSSGVSARSAESLSKRRGRDAFLPVTQLVGSLLLFTTPNYIVFCLESLDGLAVHPLIISGVTLCLTLMPTINAYIYGVKSRLIRQTFKRLLHRYLYKQDVSLEIERRLSLRSQGSQNSLYRHHSRRASCPILVPPSSSPRARADFWLGGAFSSPKGQHHTNNLRRQSLCILEEGGKSSLSSSSYPIHRILNPLRPGLMEHGLPPFKLLTVDSVIKLSPIEEQAASSEVV